jgi:hypothetical protein
VRWHVGLPITTVPILCRSMETIYYEINVYETGLIEGFSIAHD